MDVWLNFKSQNDGGDFVTAHVGEKRPPSYNTYRDADGVKQEGVWYRYQPFESTGLPPRKYFATTQQQEDILQNWHYHPPFGDQAERYKAINRDTKAAAMTMIGLCPPSEDLNRAINKLKEARMWANSAIACNEKPEFAQKHEVDPC